MFLPHISREFRQRGVCRFSGSVDGRWDLMEKTSVGGRIPRTSCENVAIYNAWVKLLREFNCSSQGANPFHLNSSSMDHHGSIFWGDRPTGQPQVTGWSCHDRDPFNHSVNIQVQLRRSQDATQTAEDIRPLEDIRPRGSFWV